MVPVPDQGESLERAPRARPGRVEHRPRPLRLHRRADPAPRPGQGRPGPHQDPPGSRPGARPGRGTDLHLAHRGQARHPRDHRPAQRRPRRLPAAEPRRVDRFGGALDPFQPQVQRAHGVRPPPHPPASAASPSPQTSGSGRPSPPTPRSSPASSGTPPSASAPSTAPAPTGTTPHPHARRTYLLRGRVRCRPCRRRMHGATRRPPGTTPMAPMWTTCTTCAPTTPATPATWPTPPATRPPSRSAKTCSSNRCAGSSPPGSSAPTAPPC